MAPEKTWSREQIIAVLKRDRGIFPGGKVVGDHALEYINQVLDGFETTAFGATHLKEIIRNFYLPRGVESALAFTIDRLNTNKKEK